MRRAYKFRLFPNANQVRELGIMLETHRRLYNACLAQRIELYQTHGFSLQYGHQSAWFGQEREHNPWFAKLNFSSAQATMRRLNKSYDNFFRRVKTGSKPGFPRFKAKERFDSVEFPSYGDGIRLSGNRLRVQHVGIIRCKAHREVDGRVKTATILRDADKWFVVLSCDLGTVTVPQSTNPAVGIDVGIESFYTTSDGHHEPNPRYLKSALPQLRRVNRAVSRKTKGGKNRKKVVVRLRSLHSKVRNLRHEHKHKTALNLVRRNGLVAVESLNIKGMLGNHRLSRVIADAAWGGFIATLKHKAESAGVSVVEVSARNTSQECSACGQVVKKSLSVRIHSCPHCGVVLHRDVNAARNILSRALQVRTGPVGANGHEAVAQEAVCFS